MDQLKIGKFIAKCRKEKKLTQSQLAEKLNITDRAVSKWETGKGMPDPSIMLNLCNELGINVNELLTGERIQEENYKEKANENIVSMIEIVDKSKKKSKKMTVICISIFILVSLYIIAKIGYNYVETTVNYDGRVIYGSFTADDIIYSVEGIDVLKTYYETRYINNEILIFFTNKIRVADKIESHRQSWESMAELIYGKNDYHRNSKVIIPKCEVEKDGYNCIKLYYTEEPLNDIKHANEEKLNEIISHSNLIAEEK